MLCKMEKFGENIKNKNKMDLLDNDEIIKGQRAQGRSVEARNKTIKAIEIKRQEMMLYGYGFGGVAAGRLGEHFKAYFELILRDIEEKDLKSLWDNFTRQLPYRERHLIMPVDDDKIGGCVRPGIWTFRRKNIPACIKFPIGHPVSGQLYIGHPYRPELYVPLGRSELTFFHDKLDELCYLLQCLGAEEMTLTAVRGEGISEMDSRTSHVDGGIDVVAFSGSSSYDSTYNRQRDATMHNERTMRQTFDPMVAPYVPDNLVWYSEQPQWQRLVKQRLNGNMLDYSEFVSTKQTSFISEAETSDVKAKAEFLWAKAGVNVSSASKREFRQSEETEWKVEARFRSMKEFGK